jgi:hypothetical protein
MPVGIELLPLRLDLPHAVLLEHVEELALGQLDAVEQRLHAGIDLLADLIIQRLHGAGHVVGNADDIAGEIDDAVEPRVGDVALGAPAQVLGLCQGPPPAVVQIGDLPLELGRRIGFGRGILLGLGRSLVGAAGCIRHRGSVL